MPFDTLQQLYFPWVTFHCISNGQQGVMLVVMPAKRMAPMTVFQINVLLQLQATSI